MLRHLVGQFGDISGRHLLLQYTDASMDSPMTNALVLDPLVAAIAVIMTVVFRAPRSRNGSSLFYLTRRERSHTALPYLPSSSDVK